MEKSRNYLMKGLLGLSLVCSAGITYLGYSSHTIHQQKMAEIENMKRENLEKGRELIRNTWYDALKIAKGRDEQLSVRELENLLQDLEVKNIPRISDNSKVEYVFRANSHELGEVAVIIDSSEIAVFGQEKVLKYLEAEKTKKP